MIALTIENCKVGMKVVINPEKMEHYRKDFTEGKQYIIEVCTEECIYIRDDNNNLRGMYPYRFYIYEEAVEMIKVNDYVKRKDGVEGFIVFIYPSGLIRLNTKKGVYKRDGFIKTDPPVNLPANNNLIDYDLLDKLAIGSGQGVCSYVVVDKNDKIHYARNQPCASALGAYSVITNNKIKTIGFNISKYLDRVEGYQNEFTSFLKYVVFESPWSKYYVKDTIENILQKGIFLDVNNPHSYVVAAHIALRIGYEHESNRLKVFQEALNQGFSGHVAFIVSQCTYYDKDKDHLVSFHNSGWHHCMSSLHSVKDIVSFFTNGYMDSKEKHTAEGLKRYSIQESIGIQYNNEESVFNLLNSDVINYSVPGKFGEKSKIIKGSFKVAVAKACMLIASKF